MKKFPLIVCEAANSINLISFPDELMNFNELQQMAAATTANL